MSNTTRYAGTVQRSFYCNVEKGWMTGVLALKDGSTIRFAGNIACEIGTNVEVFGQWGRHEKYGPQFEVTKGTVTMDETPEGIASLLASDASFEKIGPSRAEAIVKATAQVAAEMDVEVSQAFVTYAERIADISGVSLEIVQAAAETWASRRDFYELASRLVDQGWSQAQARNIIDEFGDNSLAMIGENPYRLIGKVERFGFKTVDAVAAKMGVRKTDPRRLLAGVAFCLDEIARNGSTYTTRIGLYDEARNQLAPDTMEAEDAIQLAIDQLVDMGEIIVDIGPGDEEIVASARLARAEVYVFNWLDKALRDDTVAEAPIDTADETIASLNDGQFAALKGIAHHRCAVISGGAGVGKTYTMSAICRMFHNIKLGAPTGKAAKRLAFATGREAKTIHRLLEPMPNPGGGMVFTRNGSNPVDADIIVIDEFSMVDVSLAQSLLRAIAPTTRLLLVGDHNQIPSVGAGALLRDILENAQRYPNSVHVLNQVVRQAGALDRNTRAILDGTVRMDKNSEWGVELIDRGAELGIPNMVAQIVGHISCLDGVDPAFDVQVLSPTRKGPLGTAALNAELQIVRQRRLGNVNVPRCKEGEQPKPLVGDRIIWTKNDYELGLFNGDQATVLEVRRNGSMLIRTDEGAEKDISPGKRKHLELAYAITFHKSQGSEWPYVVMVASTKHYFMHDRNLLYTGAGRASKSLTIVGDSKGIRSFANATKSERRATLGQFLMTGEWIPSSVFQKALS